MSKAKAMLTVVVAVFALSAIASASASAASSWMVNGTELSGSQALATTARVTKVAKLTFSSVTVECSGNLEGVAPQIEGVNMGQAEHLTFTECKATGGNCSLAKSMKEKVSTLPLLAEATLDEKPEENTLGVLILFKPKTGTLFATIGFEGSKCSAEEVSPVKGTVKVLAPEGRDEKTLQTIEAKAASASGELKVGSSAAELSGAAELKLANSETWSLL